MAAKNDLCNASTAAARIGITPQAMARLCQQGDVPGAIKLGNQWLIPAGSLAKIPRRGPGRPWPKKKKRIAK